MMDTPPRKEFVPLTDEEFRKLMDSMHEETLEIQRKGREIIIIRKDNLHESK